jgi:hypothetical protein
MLGKEGKALSLRRRLARSAAERSKKSFLMPVAPKYEAYPQQSKCIVARTFNYTLKPGQWDRFA